MAQTAGQLLGQNVPDCQWIPQITPNTTSTQASYPKFPDHVREWTGFFRAVRQQNLPPGQFQIFATNAQLLRVEDDAKTRLYFNVLAPVEALLPQGMFGATPLGFLGASDYVLCTNNLSVAKMPVEMKTRHNLDLCDYNFWQIYRYNDRRGIMDPGDRRFDPNFRFKKRILSQIFGQMACNGLHYAILSNYSDTYFLKREETNQTTLYITRVVKPADTNPTLRECVYYISLLAINGVKLGHADLDNISSNDDDDDDSSYHPDDEDDPDYDPSDDGTDGTDSSDGDGDGYAGLGKRKKTSASSSKGITTVDKYIGGGTFGKVFSGYYDGQLVAWKTCDAYKEQEATKMLKHEAHVYSVLKECQGHAIPHLSHQGYIYDGYLFALVLQLIEDAHHVDPETRKKNQ